MKNSEKAKHNPERDNVYPGDEQVIDESQSFMENKSEKDGVRSEQSQTETQSETQTETQPEVQSEAEESADVDTVPALKKELEDLKNTYLRLLAEYDNYRKRTAREKESYYTNAKSETVKALLPVYDNLERAVNNPTTDEAYKKGIELIFQQIKEIFGALGITEIEAEGVNFDPEKHNAVMHIEDDKYGENSIVEVFQAGFEVDGHVIRHAVVKVAN